MSLKPLFLALAVALLPVTVAGAQDGSTTGTARTAARAIPAIDSVANAALLATASGPTNDAAAAARRGEGRRWVRTAKWSLLGAAAAFGAYALANSRTEHADSRAQIGILGGQLSLLGSVGLFIYDLRREHQTPEDIPFEQPAPDDPAVPSGVRDPR